MIKVHDDPNESSAVFLLSSDNKHAVCGTNFSPMQINFFAENISDDSSLWTRLLAWFSYAADVSVK